jgi:hypothetical protein
VANSAVGSSALSAGGAITQYGSNPHYYGSNYASGSGFSPSAPSAQYNFPSPSQYYGSIQQQQQQQGISNQFYNSTGFNPNSSYFQQQAQSSGAYSQYPYNNNTTAYTLNATSGYFNNGSQGAYTQNINNSNASQNTTIMQQAIDSGSYESAAAAANNATTSNPYGHYSTNFSAAFPGSATVASAAHNNNNNNSNQSSGSGPSYTMTTLNGNNNSNNNNTVAYQGSNMLALSQTEQRRSNGIIPPKQIVVYRPSIHKSKQRYTVVA